MSLLDFYRDQTRWVTRGKMENVPQGALSHDFDETKILNAINYFDRNGDLELLKQKTKERFGITIKPRNKDTSSNASEWQTDLEVYVRGTVGKAVDVGMYEQVITGIGGRIVRAVSTLSSQPDAYFSYYDSTRTDETGKPMDSEETGELIDLVRTAGMFGQVFESVDFAASAVETAYMHIYGLGYDLNYDCVLPNNVWVIYGDKVVDHCKGREDITRAPDTTRINDAIAVIVRMATVDSATNKQLYLAYVGGCEDYPDGRMVRYEATEIWPIPNPGDDNADDYETSGVICNPLTYLLNHGNDKQKQLITTEYPVIEWTGGYRTIGSTKSPVTTSLYETSMELELAWSRMLMYALANMRGVNVFTRDQSSTTNLPNSLENIVLPAGVTFQKLFGGASEGTTAKDMVVALTKQVAAGYDVPGYMIVQEGAIPESGVALAIQTAPLQDFRLRRFRINEPKMDRFFEVEKAWLAAIHGKDALGIIPHTIKQEWNPGTWTPPMDEATRTQTLVAQRDAWIIDHPELVRRANSLPTIAEAIDRIDEYRDRDPDYDKEQAAPTTPGLFGNG